MSSPPNQASDRTTFDRATATALLADFNRFIISLPILRDVLTNPGSERLSSKPVITARLGKLNRLRQSLDALLRAYKRKHNKTQEERELALALGDKYTDCLVDFYELVTAHNESVPVNEAAAAAERELRAERSERMQEVMERRWLTR